jgi:hypothetical protein
MCDQCDKVRALGIDSFEDAVRESVAVGLTIAFTVGGLVPRLDHVFGPEATAKLLKKVLGQAVTELTRRSKEAQRERDEEDRKMKAVDQDVKKAVDGILQKEKERASGHKRSRARNGGQGS